MNQFFEWDSIVVRGNESGTKKTTCPVCSETRKKKKDPCLYVNFESGVAKCYNCDALSFRESNQTERKEYTKIEPLPKTQLSDKLVKWIEETRGISLETLSRFNISEEMQYQPAKGKELNNIVFNYFEGAKLVNKKYRSGTKDFTQTKGGKPIFYNINSVLGSEQVYIVEGEFDVLAMYEGGFKECISLPNGANDNDEFWINSEKYLKDVKHFIIATDNDEKGIIVRDKIAQRLGRFKCSFVEFKNKDANGDLIANCLEESIKNARRFPINGTFSVGDLYDDIVELYDKGIPETIGLKDAYWKGLNDVFTVMRGHLVTGTGIPSHGKSTFTEFYAMNLIKDYGMKVSFFSPEHSPMQMHQANFIQRAIGKPFFKMNGEERVTKEDIARYKEWANERLYLTSPSGTDKPTWTWLFEKFKEQLFSFGIDVFVIDAFNKLLFEKGSGGKEAIDQVLTELTAFAQSNNVIIFLIAHPTKMKKEDNGQYAIPTLYDCSGSSDFRNQTHDGFAVHRFFDSEVEQGYTKFVNLKTKFGFQGKIGESVDLYFNPVTGRYFPKGFQQDRSDYTEHLKIKQEEIFSAIKPNNEFENLTEYEKNKPEDCPF